MKIMHRILSTILMTVFISFGAVAGTLQSTPLSPVSTSADQKQSATQTTGSSRQFVQYGGGGGASPPDPRIHSVVVRKICFFGFCFIIKG